MPFNISDFDYLFQETHPRFEGPIKAAALLAPDKVEIIGTEGDLWIEWRCVSTKEVKPEGALEQFIRLADPKATAEMVRDFVLRWGPLNDGLKTEMVIEGDGISGRYSLDEFSILLQERSEAGQDIPHIIMQDRWAMAPVQEYIQTAQQFRAIMAISHSLRMGQRPREEDWGHAIQTHDPDGFRWSETDVEFPSEPAACLLQEKIILGMEVSRLLHETNAHPLLVWGGATPKLTLVGSDLVGGGLDSILMPNIFGWEELCKYLGRDEKDSCRSLMSPVFGTLSLFHIRRVLVFQLVAAITSGLYRCDSCGNFFMPKGKKPRSDRSCFCSQECSKEKHLEQNRASYANRKTPTAG